MPKIKEILAERNISQNQLAKLIHDKYPIVDKSMLSKFSNGIIIPSKKILEELCLILNATTNDLYSFEELDYKNCFVENRGVATPLKLKSFQEVSSKNKKPFTFSVRIDKETREFLSDSDVMKNYGVKTFSEFIRLLIKEKIEEVKENG